MRRPWDVIFWWEIRRIQYNLALFGAGVVTIAVILTAGSRYVEHFDFEPFGIFVGAVLYGLAANAAYTLGWITELLWTANSQETAIRRRRMFRLGLLGSLALTLLPALVIPAILAAVRLAD